MAESSKFWNTSGTGDGPGAGYARAAISTWLAAVFGRSTLSSGILRGLGGELAVTGASSPLSMAAGAAMVDGLYYENTAAQAVTVTTPTGGTTGGRVVLRADWSAQTVRAVAKLNTFGNAAPPALTQTSGTTYELGLYTFTITTGGVIAALARDPALPTGYARFASQAVVEMLALAGAGVLGNPGSAAGLGQLIAVSGTGVFRRTGTSLGIGSLITAMIAAGGVDIQALAADGIDDTKAGARVPQFYRRQGGDGTAWTAPGANDYTPAGVRMVAGVLKVYIEFGYDFTIALPAGVFSAAPLVLASAVADSGAWAYKIGIAATSPTSISGKISKWSGTGGLVDLHWLAIGPAAS